MSRSIGDVFLTVRADLTQFQADLTKLNSQVSRSASELGRSLSNIGRTLNTTGSAMTRNLTLPIGLAGLAASKMALDFDTSLRQVVALSDVTASEIDGIRDSILELGPAIGKGPQELAEAFYFVASAGFQAEEAMGVLETSAKAAAAGMGTTQDVAKVLAGVINSYGHANLSAATAADQLTAAVQKGSAEASDFAGVIGRVAPGAAALGVSFDQVTAALAGMTNVGISADEAATSLVQIFSSLLKPTVQADAAMESLGLTAQGLRQQLREKGLLDTLRTLEERFANNETASAAVFGNIRALRGITALLGIDTEQLNAIFAATADSLGSLGRAYDETEGPQRELDRAMADLEATGITLGQDVLPVVIDVIKQIAAGAREIGKWWRSLNQDQKGSIVQWLAWVAIAGPALILIGKLVSGLGALFKMIGFLTSAKGIPALIATLGGLKAATFLVLGPISLLVGALVALGMAWNDYMKREKPVEASFISLGLAAGKFYNQIQGRAVQAARRMGISLDEFKERVVEYAEATSSSFDDAVNAVESGWDDMERTTSGMTAAWAEAWLDMAIVTDKNGRLIAQSSSEIPGEVAAVLRDGQWVIEPAAEEMIDPVDDAIAAARVAAAEETRQLIRDVASVLSTAPGELEDELTAFFEALGEPFVKADRLAEIEGQAARGEWIAAFGSGDPQAEAATFEKFSTDILDQLELLLPDTFAAGAVVPTTFMSGIAGAVPAAIAVLQSEGKLGEFANAFDLAQQLEALGEPVLAAYVRGMELERVTAELKSGQLTDLSQAFDLANDLDAIGQTNSATYIRSLATGLETGRTGTMRTQLMRNANDVRQQMTIDLGPQGRGAGYSFGNGLAETQGYINDKAKQIKGGVTRILEFAGSPPYTAVRKIGANVGTYWMQEIAAAVQSGLPQLAGATGSVASALSLAPGFTGPAAYPSQTITAGLPAGSQIAPTGQVGGVTNNYNLHVSGRINVDEARDAVDELRRLAGMDG